MTFVLGLTGGIASGKSTISAYFKEQGIPVIDADVVAREIVEPGTKGLRDITYHFGDDMLLPNGSLNRKKLGKIIFSDKQERLVLDELLKDELRHGIEKKIDHERSQQVPLIVLDAPLLFEAGYEHTVDEVMLSYIPKDIQITRLSKRDNIDNLEARMKIGSQQSLDEKKEKANIVIDNSGSIESTYKQVKTWLDSFYKS